MAPSRFDHLNRNKTHERIFTSVNTLDSLAPNSLAFQLQLPFHTQYAPVPSDVSPKNKRRFEAIGKKLNGDEEIIMEITFFCRHHQLGDRKQRDSQPAGGPGSMDQRGGSMERNRG